MTDHPEPGRERWNARYRRDGAGVGREPSEWLVAHRDLVVAAGPGRALDLACGGGRNALALAGWGFDVDAVDVSDVAIDALRDAVAATGAAVTPLRADLDETPFPRPPYRAILNFNFLSRPLFGRIVDALDEGGVLVFETFMRDPQRARVSLEPGELLEAFGALEVLAHHEDPEEHRAGLVARRASRGTR